MNSEQLPDVCISLNFYGSSFDPEEISSRLGIEPTDAQRAGDPVPQLTKNVRPAFRRSDGWRLMLFPRETIEVDGLLREFRTRVDVDPALIKQTCAELKLDAVIICGVLQPISATTPALGFPAEFLGWAAEIGAEIYIDLIIAGESTDN